MTRTTLGVRSSFLLLVAALAAPAVQAQAVWCENTFPPCDTGNPSSDCFRPPPPDDRCDCDTCKKSPCYVATGVFEGAAADLELPTPGLPLAASRSYHSSQMIDGPTGFGWSSSLVSHLYTTTYFFAPPSTYLTEVVVTMPGGGRYRFSDNGNNTFAPPLGRYDRLVRNADGTWDLTLQRSRTVMHYGTDGALLSTTDEYGNAQLVTYDGNGRLERVADTAGSGRYIDVFWGADGRIALLQDSAGRTVEYTYNANGVMTSVTNPLGQSTFYSYADGRYVPLLAAVRDHWNRVVSETFYDSVDRTTSYTEQGELWTYTYNYQNDRWRTAKTDSAGNRWVFTHGMGGLVTLTVPPAGAGGAPSSVIYYGDGAIREEADPVGVKNYRTYDEQGRLTSITRDYQGSKAVRFEYSYDPGFPDKVTAVTPRNPTTGQVDPSWQAWQYDYYQAGSAAPGALHHEYRVRADGGLDTMATYTYDARGQVLSETDPAGGTTDYAYSSAGELVSVTNAANNDLGIRPVTSYTHDALGRVTSVTDPLGAVTTYTFDALGRPLTVTLPAPAPGSPLDFTTSHSYDDFAPVTGLLFTAITDANGNVARQGYDQFGRLVQSIDHLGARTRYGFAGDLLVTITDANDNVTTYTYDPLKRLAATVFPDGASETYGYFADGLPQRRTDRKGQTITYTYDHFKRSLTKQYPDLTTVTYTHSGESLTQVVDTSVSPSETHTFAYDSSYRLASNTQAGRGTINYTYTANDQVASYAVGGGGPTATYSYYPNGSLATIQWSPVLGEFTYSYTLRGQYERIAFPNGQSREYSYDEQGRLLNLANRQLGVGNIATFTYGYDRDHATGTDAILGQRTSMTADTSLLGLGGAETRYRYDANYQLSRADYPSGAPLNGEVHQWTYDAIGNRLTDTVNGATSTYSYFKNGTNPLNGQRLQSDSSRTFVYDNNGNTTSITAPGGGILLVWDFQNRMTGNTGATTITFGYDYSGRRSTTTAAAGSNSFLYNGLDRVADLGTAPAHYLFGPAIDEPLAMLRDDVVYYYSVDALGSVVAVNDASGLTRNEYTYDAWGLVPGQGTSVDSPFGFSAREPIDSGQSFYRARYYDPSAGRFISEDPLQAGGDPNLYAYVLNDPVSLFDPMGLKALTYPSNCCAKESQATEAAAQGFCKAAKGGACRAVLKKFGLGPCTDDKCRKGFKVRCIKEGEDCGRCGGPCNNIADPSKTIFLQSRAFNPTCGKLQNTFAHEVSHMCGIGADAGNDPAHSRNRKKARSVGDACEGG